MSRLFFLRGMAGERRKMEGWKEDTLAFFFALDLSEARDGKDGHWVIGERVSGSTDGKKRCTCIPSRRWVVRELDGEVLPQPSFFLSLFFCFYLSKTPPFGFFVT